MTPMPDRPLFIPVILGTVRTGRMSEPCARLMTSELARRAGIETELIDIARLPLRTDDAGEAIKDAGFSARMQRADALVIVAPEYNHGYSGLLKHVLDSCLEEYIHKAAGVVGVSAGAFGGVRGIQDLLPVLRELGLVTIFWDVNFGNVNDVFDASGTLRDQSFLPRIDKFLKELVWMARTLRYGREHVTEDEASPPVVCDQCGATMNRHAEKAIQSAAEEDAARADPALGGVVESLYSCARCGAARALH
jgi:NAD(P)H-dependent FMN reductase